MYRLFLTPSWFNGWDLVFDLIGLLVAFLITAYSFRIYRISAEKKFCYFSFAFLLVTLAFFSKIITFGMIYFQPARRVADAFAGPLLGAGNFYAVVFYRLGFFAQMIAMLSAWLLIFFISQKSRGRTKRYYEISQIALFVYLILLISVISNFNYYVFYLTSSVLLGLTVLNYYKNYLNAGKNKNTFLVLLSFLLILAANLVFVFVFWQEICYVFGEILMLSGFLLLLYTYTQIIKK